MTVVKLKTKNQLTVPSEVVRKLHLKVNELFMVDVEENYIKLMPVEIEPRYTPAELEAIDRLVEKEKSKAKVFKPGREFQEYIRKIAQ
ncbi:MAG: AbrB/MazE/SpoVT family DNA-binding domain-containing protein [Candidatus Omnitrophica bacterium]|nr:AbrB/MazE/SpoVT family DNA-binding domain-containing protein [Candidatus Omnitrophota bacterium]